MHRASWKTVMSYKHHQMALSTTRGGALQRRHFGGTFRGHILAPEVLSWKTRGRAHKGWDVQLRFSSEVGECLPNDQSLIGNLGYVIIGMSKWP